VCDPSPVCVWVCDVHVHVCVSPPPFVCDMRVYVRVCMCVCVCCGRVVGVCLLTRGLLSRVRVKG